MCDPGNAVRHAGGGPAGLAEEHSVSSLHKEQQTDHLVLAGTDTHTHTFGAFLLQFLKAVLNLSLNVFI